MIKPKLTPVLGVTAPPAKPTIAGGLWLASVATLPVAVLVGAGYLIGWLT
ncbi:MAG: hypothetical protein NXH97_01765 [Rhodobacteraceae bacterium]|nr:hypothetical protein [Paracoccaceae bacterium]